MIGNIAMVQNCTELTDFINLRNSFKVPNQYPPSKLKVIMVDDLNPNQQDYICGSILLPHAKAMEYLIDGDTYNFENEYLMKLNCDSDVKDYLTVLLAGLMEKSFDYVFFFDFINNYNMPDISKVLLNFLYNSLGLVVYPFDQIKANNSLLFNQSMIPEAFINNKNMVMSAGYSSATPNLFMKF